MKKFMLILVMMAAAAPLYAAQGDLATFGIALGAGLAISLAALGGGIGQGIAMRGALEGIALRPGHLSLACLGSARVDENGFF